MFRLLLFRLVRHLFLLFNLWCFRRIFVVHVDKLERNVLSILKIVEDLFRRKDIFISNGLIITLFVVHQIIFLSGVLFTQRTMVGDVQIGLILVLGTGCGDGLQHFTTLFLSSFFAVINSGLLNSGEQSGEVEIVTEDEYQHKEGNVDQNGEEHAGFLDQKLADEVAEIACQEGIVGVVGEESEGDGEPCHRHHHGEGGAT